MAKGDIKTIKDFFGFRPGDGLKDFADEVKALSEDEKRQLVDGINDETFNY